MKTYFKEVQGKRKDKNFSSDDKFVFMYCNECWSCGRNSWDSLHHTLGGNFDEADSILNATPIHNAECHINGGHHFSEEETNKFLAYTLRYLFYQNYKLTEKDFKFLTKFKDRYEKTEVGAKYYQYYTSKR